MSELVVTVVLEPTEESLCTNMGLGCPSPHNISLTVSRSPDISLRLGQVTSVSLTLAFPGTLVGQGAWRTGGQALPFV